MWELWSGSVSDPELKVDNTASRLGVRFGKYLVEQSAAFTKVLKCVLTGAIKYFGTLLGIH